MKFDYDSIPTLMLFAAGLFVMFASPPVVSYDSVDSAGKNMPFDGEENSEYGKAFVLESDDYTDKALAITEAYSNLDVETLSSLMNEEMQFFTENMDDMETYSWRPWSMVPLRRVDDNGAFVVSWSYDTSVQKNGSKAATHYIDILRFDDADEGKLSGIWSTSRPDPENSEYGLREGGKFIGLNAENEYSGRPFVFSNRGEVEKMEQFMEAVNSLDVDAMMKHVKFPLNYNGTEITEERMREIAGSRKSQSWKPWAMIPIKIKDTDPESGLIVHSRVSILGEDDSVYEFEAAETYFFDLDGMITRVNQFTREVPTENNG